MVMNRHHMFVASVIGMLFAVAVMPCHGKEFQSLSIRTVYTHVVATSKTAPDYYLDRDLYMQQLPAGKSIRLTNWAQHPLLDRGINAPKWSPDGNYVLFEGHLKNHKPVMPQNNWPFYPWILDVRTKKLKLVGQTKNRWYMNVAWLPNQQEIVARVVYGKKPQFYYNLSTMSTEVMSGGSTRLAVINIKTGKERTIRQGGLFWVLPINKKIITYDWVDDRLSLYDLSSGKWRTLLKSTSLDVAAISPDGKRFAYYNKGVLRVCNIHTSKVQKLYNARDVYDRGEKLIWSPNGKWIVIRHSSGNIISADPPIASSTSYLTLIDITNGRSNLLQKDSRNVPIGWTSDSKNMLLKRVEKNNAAFPYDAKTVMIKYPISAVSPETPFANIIGYQECIDIAQH